MSEAESDLVAQSQELARVNRELRKAHDRLAELALRDPLTGLLGRAVFLESVSKALARLKRRSHLVAVLFVDLDRLKFVNDTYGHAVGDELLRCCGDQLQHSVRPSDIVARIGGDEFVVLLDELTEEREADLIAERILTALSRPCTLHPVAGPRVAVPATASIGIAVAHTSDIGGEALISRADAAMYRAKGQGRGRCVRYDERAFAELGQRTQTAAELRVAVTEGQLRLHYQPIVDVSSGRASAVEALLRWQHPRRGLLTAGEFLDVAEDSSLIIELGHWVLRESCRQLAEWDARLGDEAPESMFINVSTAEFSRPELRSVLIETVGNTGVDPGRLVLEITETGLLAEPAVTGEATKTVTELGCALAIDDFGTGYSSLSRLTTLPARILKIDKSFVRGLTDNPESLAIVSAVLLLAHNLRKTVVAEGVESAECYEVLRELGCHYAQGYYLSRPTEAAELTEQLKRPLVSAR
jgi:diguanylate cyclase (GGDEF)-like protein